MKNLIENPSESQIKAFQKCTVKLSQREIYKGTIIQTQAKTMIPSHSVRVEISDYIPTLKRHETFVKACHPDQILAVWE